MHPNTGDRRYTPISARDIGVILRKLCEQKKAVIIEAEPCKSEIQVWEQAFLAQRVDTVGKSETKKDEYIRKQLEEGIMEDQISLKEYFDPFTGEKNTKA